MCESDYSLGISLHRFENIIVSCLLSYQYLILLFVAHVRSKIDGDLLHKVIYIVLMIYDFKFFSFSLTIVPFFIVTERCTYHIIIH